MICFWFENIIDKNIKNILALVFCGLSTHVSWEYS